LGTMAAPEEDVIQEVKYGVIDVETYLENGK
jgi:hypothetical protein